MKDMIDNTYLPFTAEELKPHFFANVDGQIAYYQKSASRYHQFMKDHPDTAGIPITTAKIPRQIEKDERFWTITATKNAFDHPSRTQILTQLLKKTFGPNPPISSLGSWDECLNGELRLYFEACLPSAQSYVKWLRDNLEDRQIIPYVLDAAARKNARTLEGATHVDAMFLNVKNGFAWLIEAKVLSEVSTTPLNLARPPGVISLSHVALPFPPDDPLYGTTQPKYSKTVFLGQMAIKGERNLLRFPADWLLRLRHNPFYDYLETRVIGWLEKADPQSGTR